jgi:hypothetical protein
VHREGGDVGGTDDAPDGKGGAELIAAPFQVSAEQRRGQRRVDEPGRDEVCPASSGSRAAAVSFCWVLMSWFSFAIGRLTQARYW